MYKTHRNALHHGKPPKLVDVYTNQQPKGEEETAIRLLETNQSVLDSVVIWNTSSSAQSINRQNSKTTMSLLAPPQNVLDLLHESLSHNKGGTTIPDDEILSYVAFLAAGLAQANEFDATVWADVIQPYLEQTEDETLVTAESAETFRRAFQNAYTDQDDEDSYGGDDDGEEVCNLRFNLAYGGKILLHNTKLHLLRGRRYALVGQNGVGKVRQL